MIRGRQRAMALLDRLHLFEMALRGRRVLPRRNLVVFTYHRIAYDEPGLDEWVISASPEEFDVQMEITSRYATPLTIQELARVLTGRAPMPENATLITFDDGYADNHRNALPILRRHGVPATFFVTTGFIGGRRLPWWDRLSYIIKQTKVERLRVRYPMHLDLTLMPGRERNYARRSLLRLVKHVTNLDLGRFFLELEQAAQVEVDEERLSDDLFMSWQQVRELHDAGMEIGAHTHTHRVLHTIDLAEAVGEMLRPRELIREHIGCEPLAIAYPVGYPLPPGSGLRDLVRAAGYQMGFTFMPGIITGAAAKSGVDPLNLPRYAVDRSGVGGVTRFKAMLCAPTSLG